LDALGGGGAVKGMPPILAFESERMRCTDRKLTLTAFASIRPV
jgi:hypothetical protein